MGLPSSTQALSGWQEAAPHEALAGLGTLQHLTLGCRDTAEALPLPPALGCTVSGRSA